LNKITKTKITSKVESFYSKNPFPSYQTNENKFDILDKGNKNPFARDLKNFIGSNKKVLEAGCGTAQLSCYLSVGTNNLIHAFDATRKSLNIANNFFKKEKIYNVKIIEGDILDNNALPKEYYDVICCSGVLHHTEDPYKGFKNLLKFLKKDGVIIIGLYNKYYRIRTNIRRFLYSKIRNKKIKNLFIFSFDPILRQLKKNLYKNRYKIKAWLMDQYHHPVEKQYSIDQIFKWFKANDVEIESYFPNNFENSMKLFEKKNKDNSTFFERILIQLIAIFSSLGSEGGLFFVLGRKKN